MLVPLVLYFLCPCASLTNYFELSLIHFFPYYPFIKYLYSSIFPVVVSSTAFILRRGLIDGLVARLISCWTRCCNLSGICIVVNSALVLLREEVLG